MGQMKMDAGIAQSVEQLIRNQQVVSSSLISSSKKKGLPIGSPFFLGFGRPRRPPPFGISMLGVGKAAPAQFPAAGREFTRHSARGPEGALGSVSSNGLKDENIDFSRPFQLVANDISLATSLFILLQSSSRAHSAAPRFQTGPAAAGQQG